MTTTRLLNWDAFPNGEISGLTDAEIEATLYDFDLEKAGNDLDSAVIDQLDARDRCDNKAGGLLPAAQSEQLAGWVWYHYKQPVGLNSIGNYMRDISKAAGQSKLYTGHCVRATVVAELFNAGHTPTDIATVTGHKDSRSVERYLKNSKRAKYKTVEMAKTLVATMALPSVSPEAQSDNEGSCSVASQAEQPVGGSGDDSKKGRHYYFSNCTVHLH